MNERFIINICRFMLGGVFLIFGLNYFFEFMPLGALEKQEAVEFMSGLDSAGYFFPFLRIVEISMGLLLISGFYTALALVILMPVNINIFLFNLFLDPTGFPLSLVMMIAHIYLAWVYREHYKGLFKNRL